MRYSYSLLSAGKMTILELMLSKLLHAQCDTAQVSYNLIGKVLGRA